MKNYLFPKIGKQVKAERMTLGQYEKKTGQKVLAPGSDEDAFCYLIEWPNGLIKFLPEKDFEKEAVEINSTPAPFGFSRALSLLKEGNMLSRKCWAKGSFVYLQVDSEFNIDQIIQMNSLPSIVKREFEERSAYENFSPIRFKKSMAMVSPDNIITNYNPPNLDILAVDWYVL